MRNLDKPENPNFYSVIIGTELLNGRRADKHFSFINSELLNRGWEQKASFIIEDDPILMQNIFNLIKSDLNSVMFCFGGIGATPDDYTREVAIKSFTDEKSEFHEELKQNIINQFGDEAYPHRINMANLPIGSKLLKNVVNSVSGFYLENRFFFMPGFVSMSHPMVIEALDMLYPKTSLEKYRKTMTVFTSENDLVNSMKMMPKELDFSSLPKFIGDKRAVVLSLAGYEKEKVDNYFQIFIDFCTKSGFEFELRDVFENK